MKKRIISALVVLAMILTMAPSAAARPGKSAMRAGIGEPLAPDGINIPVQTAVNADTVEEYLQLCTGYPSYLTLTTEAECRLWTMPCDDLVCEESDSVVLTNKGDTLTATGLYCNTEDKYWYQVSWGGQACYVYAANVSVAEALFFDVEASGLQVPGMVAAGASFPLAGEVTARYNQLGTLTGAICAEGEALSECTAAADSHSFSLRGSVIDNTLRFGTLEPGSYEYVLSVRIENCFSDDGLTLIREPREIELIREPFQVVEEGGHICDRGELAGFTEAHPHRAIYRCSVCGSASESYAETKTMDSCEQCCPGKPELNVLPVLDGEVTITWNDAANTTHTQLLLERRDADGAWVSVEEQNPAHAGFKRILEPGEYRVRLCAQGETDGTWADEVFFTIEFTEEDLEYVGVDVSLFQEEIDWETAMETVDYAILRCGFGTDKESQDDDRWYENADKCTELGIPFGVYLYSYAIYEDWAISEAEHVLRLLEGYDPELPIYLDLEDDSIYSRCSARQMLRHAKLFCNILEEAGYTVGIYATQSWWKWLLTSSDYDRWSRWVAQYSSTNDCELEYDQWQYTDGGRVPGIKTQVDMNIWYGALPGADHVHCYKANVLAEATCLTEGVRECICACGDSYSESFTTGEHRYGDWMMLEAPGWETEGLEERICQDCGAAEQRSMEKLPPPFEDVSPEDYFWESVLWAVEQEITNGVTATTFGPEQSCTRAQVVTFLWRAAGKPAPTVTEHPFTDVFEGEYYYDAMLWAVEQEITNGTSADTFAPDQTCTRGQVVAFLWRAAEKPAPTAAEHPFNDVIEGEYYYDAMLWAVEQGITNGTSADTFGPEKDCTRGQVVTFLYRACKE